MAEISNMDKRSVYQIIEYPSVSSLMVQNNNNKSTLFLFFSYVYIFFFR